MKDIDHEILKNFKLLSVKQKEIVLEEVRKTLQNKKEKITTQPL